MRTTTKNIAQLDKEMLRESILRSMIASFKIENINISDKDAHEIYQKIKIKLKKGV